MATTHHISPRAALVAALAAVALVLPSQAAAYGWPVKPFHRQHPVRGFFGDPRIAEDGRRQFHFGVDVAAKNGTAVYATLSGRAYVAERYVVEVVGTRGVEFSYYHIIPTVHTGQYVTAYRTVIGHILKPSGHVHFSEAHNGVFVNPLRPGAMAPFADHTAPIVRAVQVERSGRSVPRTGVSGTVDLIADVRDATPLVVPRPWFKFPVMPALVRWRILGATRWITAVDFRRTIPGPWEFASCYSRWTRQNHAGRAGRYRIYLTHGWNSAAVADGSYLVEVVASDTRGNSTRTYTLLTVANLVGRRR